MRNPFVVVLNGIITLAMIAIIMAGGILYWGKQQFDAAGPLSEDATVLIAPNSGLRSISNLLEEKGIISNGLIFVAGTSAYQMGPKLKAGEYRIPAKASMHQIMDLLASGKSILHQITIPEGLTSQQIMERIKADPVLTGGPDHDPGGGHLAARDLQLHPWHQPTGDP